MGMKMSGVLFGTGGVWRGELLVFFLNQLSSSSTCECVSTMIFYSKSKCRSIFGFPRSRPSDNIVFNLRITVFFVGYGNAANGKRNISLRSFLYLNL